MDAGAGTGNTFDRIYEIVKQIPYGRVATYGQIAALVGNKRRSRVVGYALHVNPDPEHIPCYRVVNRFGEVAKAGACGGETRQITLLEAEGIVFEDGRVNLDQYQWEKVRF
ncbi:MAG: MGMT family protein [Lachnospiraceae bacterium]|nr:MGMT family protein [Lachnospiraceae bacterium]